jgi:Ser-tRNA(Ala) deacylase AlaX
MQTLLSYFEDTYKFEDHASVVASNKDEFGYFLVLNQTIFYPQGGGQPSDQGLIEVGGAVIRI